MADSPGTSNPGLCRIAGPFFSGLLVLACLLGASATGAPQPRCFSLEGEPQQGHVLFGKAYHSADIDLNGESVLVSETGDFVIGFGRDETGTKNLSARCKGFTQDLSLDIKEREYNIERVDGLPPATVNPDPSVLERIRREGAQVAEARAKRLDRAAWSEGFIWPVTGRLSGFYGSQRVLNGEPKRPHYGLDIAAPEGTEIIAPAAGLVTLAEPDLYYSGGTIVIDHGLGFSSTFLHLSAVAVEVGTEVQQGDLIGKVGATGRATGPHLDWRMNWLNKRVDPHPLLPDMPQSSTSSDSN